MCIHLHKHIRYSNIDLSISLLFLWFSVKWYSILRGLDKCIYICLYASLTLLWDVMYNIIDQYDHFHSTLRISSIVILLRICITLNEQEFSTVYVNNFSNSEITGLKKDLYIWIYIDLCMYMWLYMYHI
jgi:hypothetical protein